MCTNVDHAGWIDRDCADDFGFDIKWAGVLG
jgi:hypothetical protein